MPGSTSPSSSMKSTTPGVGERHEVLRQIAGAVALVRMRRVVPLAAANHVAGAREPRHDLPIHAHREAADVIEVQVRRDDDVDVGRR